jgi:hypothetical protein
MARVPKFRNKSILFAKYKLKSEHNHMAPNCYKLRNKHMPFTKDNLKSELKPNILVKKKKNQFLWTFCYPFSFGPIWGIIIINKKKLGGMICTNLFPLTFLVLFLFIVDRQNYVFVPLSLGQFPTLTPTPNNQHHSHAFHGPNGQLRYIK